MLEITRPIAVMAAAFILMWGTAASAAPFTNGSFESPAFANPTFDTSPSIDNWTTSGGFIVHERGVNGASNLAAADGEQFVSFGHNDNTGGILSQAFDTVVGQSYTVTFQVTSSQGAAAQTLRATAFDDTNNNQLNFTDSAVALNSTWVSGTPLVFVATSGTSRLEFQHTVGDSTANLALDDVQVIPEPATLAILAGAGTLCLLRRRRA